MPLPIPGESQSKDDFVASCMANKTMMSEFPDDDQRLAVCMSQWGKRETIPISRGYSIFNIRSVNDEKRIIEGVATTPMQARDGDILETSGIQFKLPIPFLYRHSEPFGNVVAANIADDGISVRVQVAPAGVSASLDEHWRLVRAGIVRGLSIGWRTLQEVFDKEIGGFRILKSEWLELSAVPVPADTNATITSVRSADESILAALGQQKNRASVNRINHKSPGVSGSLKKGDEMPTSVQNNIDSFESNRATIAARMSEIMETAEAGRITGEEQQREYDGLCTDLEETDKSLKRLRGLLVAQQGAKPVPKPPAEDLTPLIPRRIEVVKEERDKLPKGTSFARAVISLIKARGDYFSASKMASDHYRDTPEVSMYLRAFVDAGDTTTSGWASQLVPAAQQMQSEFLELLRPATIIGRIPNLRRVPFNIAVPLQTGGGTYNWVGESKAKPVTSAAFSNVTLRWAKAAGIIVITKELARFSSPSAEAIIRDEMIQGCTRFLDTQFVDPNVAAVANVSPASITNSIVPAVPSGSTADDFRYDISVLMAAFITANQDPSNAVLLMSATTAMGLSLMVNALGQPEFPNISMAGGTIVGLPVIVSENVNDRVILVNASDILLADDGGITIDMSDQASVEMSSTPIVGDESPFTGAVLKSFWQNNLVGLRVERFITWLRARSSAVAWLDNVTYAPSPSSP